MSSPVILMILIGFRVQELFLQFFVFLSENFFLGFAGCELILILFQHIFQSIDDGFLFAFVCFLSSLFVKFEGYFLNRWAECSDGCHLGELFF